MTSALKWILRSILVEIFVIFIFVLTLNNYIGRVDVMIKADGEGYYEYLPSLFIRQDFVRKDVPVHSDSILYQRIQNGPYVDYKDFKVNKYPCGTAVLELPFFLTAYYTTPLDGNHDGYQIPFQDAAFAAVIVYLCLGIFFLRKLLELYNINRWIIVFVQLLLVLSTSVTNYANFDASYSHVYSLFAVTAFFFYTKSYFTTRNLYHFIIAALFFGLVMILRQVNVLILLFVPFLAGSPKLLKEGFTYLFAHYNYLVAGLIGFLSICFIQSLAWYFQTGDLLLYSYGDEKFFFDHPQLINILFSYKKGLFLYTPVVFISLFGLIVLWYKKEYYLLLTWSMSFLLITYVFSSWHSWDYGCSYGLRAYIDVYAMFFILLALLIQGLNAILRILVIALSLLTIPLNVIQSYQYKEFILHWIDMDKDMYWKVFLKTSDTYKGLIWRKDYDYSQYTLIKEINMGNTNVAPYSTKAMPTVSTRDIPDFDKVSLIVVFLDNEYKEDDSTKAIVNIDNLKGYNYYRHPPYLIQFAKKEFGTFQTGWYGFEFSPWTDNEEKIVKLEIMTEGKNCDLKNIKLKLFKHN